jgi:N6-L-threonylcarbamoyladenine synthase
VRALVRGARKAAEIYQPRGLLLAGGVACNTELRAEMQTLAEELDIPVHIPSPKYTTDNAAMIAAAGVPKLLRGENAGLRLSADVSLRLQNVDLDSSKPRKRVRYRL